MVNRLRARLDELGEGKITVIEPRPEVVGGESDKYGHPYNMLFAHVADSELRITLLRQGVLAYEPGVTVHVVEYGTGLLSWSVGMFEVSGIPGDSDAIRRALIVGITKQLFLDSKFRNAVQRCAPDPTLSLAERTYNVLRTFDLLFMPYTDGEGASVRPRPRWLLLAAPACQDAALNNKIKDYIRSIMFHVGAALFKISPLRCTVCHLDTHPSFACTYVSLEDWWGPTGTLSNMLRDNEPAPSTSPRRGMSGRGTSRGRVSRGGRSNRRTRVGRNHFISV
jgi:hypothetical protein